MALPFTTASQVAKISKKVIKEEGIKPAPSPVTGGFNLLDLRPYGPVTTSGILHVTQKELFELVDRSVDVEKPTLVLTGYLEPQETSESLLHRLSFTCLLDRYAFNATSEHLNIIGPDISIGADNLSEDLVEVFINHDEI